MTSRLRVLTPLCLACAALLLALGPVPASALGPVLAAPDLVYGVVVSVEPRVAPDTGVITTDVRVVESLPGGGTELTRFTMQGGVVGNIGMWTEHFTDLSVGDSVVARVSDQGGETVVVAAPMVDGGVAASSVPGVGSLVAGVAAGYEANGLHWADAALPVEYHVNPSGLPAGAASAIVAAAQTWEDDAGSRMDFSYEGITSEAPVGRDGRSVVGSGPVSSSGTIAECLIWYYDVTQQIFEFDISYNTDDYTFATDGRSSAYDVQGIGTHELGHTLHLLDLYDADNTSQVMYGNGHPGDTNQRILEWGDIAGVRAIYPLAVPNAAPVAVADSYAAAEDTVLAVAAPGVLGNDTDADGNAVSAVLVTGVSHGTLALKPAGSFAYTPGANFSGSDSFTYRAFDGVAYSGTVTVAIAVLAVNDAPVAVANPYATPEDTVLTVAASGVLANDTDADGNALSAGLVTGVSHGALTLSPGGSFAYTPAADYSGSDSFAYRAFDGVAYSNTVTVSIVVLAVNDAPVASDDVATVAGNGVLVLAAPGVLANDTDAEGHALSAGLVTGVSHGTLSLRPDGSFTYAPAADFSGSDSFTYRAFDGALPAPARVTITVTPAGVTQPDITEPHTASDRVAYYATSARILLAPVDDVGGLGVAHTYYALNGALAEGTTVTVPTAGSYSLVYWSVDAAGNAEAPQTVTFTIVTRPSSSGTPSRPAYIATIRRGRSFTVSGYIVRHTSGTYPVTLQFYRYQSGRWVWRKSASAKASAILTFSKYSRSTSVPYSGAWRVRARHKVGSRYRYSAYRYFTAS